MPKVSKFAPRAKRGRGKHAPGIAYVTKGSVVPVRGQEHYTGEAIAIATSLGFVGNVTDRAESGWSVGDAANAIRKFLHSNHVAALSGETPDYSAQARHLALDSTDTTTLTEALERAYARDREEIAAASAA